jgi:hypothetical protein
MKRKYRNHLLSWSLKTNNNRRDPLVNTTIKRIIELLREKGGALGVDEIESKVD